MTLFTYTQRVFAKGSGCNHCVWQVYVQTRSLLMAVKSMTDRLNVTCAYELGATFLAVAQLPFCMCVCVCVQGTLGSSFLSFVLSSYFGLVQAQHHWSGSYKFCVVTTNKMQQKFFMMFYLVDKSMIFCYCHLVETREEFQHGVSNQMQKLLLNIYQTGLTLFQRFF